MTNRHSSDSWLKKSSKSCSAIARCGSKYTEHAVIVLKRRTAIAIASKFDFVSCNTAPDDCSGTSAEPQRKILYFLKTFLHVQHLLFLDENLLALLQIFEFVTIKYLIQYLFYFSLFDSRATNVYILKFFVRKCLHFYMSFPV